MRPRGDTTLVPVRLRSALALAAVFAVGLVAFGWPFLVQPGAALDASHSGDSPVIFVAVLPLLAAVVLAELTTGGMDAKAVAMLGMLAAVGGALRALGPGAAGLEPSFAVIVLGGRVFGRGFGFVLGAVTLFVGALLTGGVGPWLPFQMIAAGWVGFFAGCLPPARGRAEVALVAGYALLAGLGYGMVINLWFWPFASYGPEVSYVAGAGFTANLGRYLVFYLTTSLAWDVGTGAGLRGGARARRTVVAARPAPGLPARGVRRTGGLRPLSAQRTDGVTNGGLVTTKTSRRPRTSTETSAPSSTWLPISARPTPVRSVGENVPDVTSPTGTSAASSTRIPGRGMPRPEATRPRSVRAGPCSRSAASTVLPQKASFFQPTAQPRRACTGVTSGLMSWPCSG